MTPGTKATANRLEQIRKDAEKYTRLPFYRADAFDGETYAVDDLRFLLGLLDEAAKALEHIQNSEKFTLLCDPADFDFDAEEAYQTGATNAFCDSAEVAREALAKLGFEAPQEGGGG